MVDPTLTPNLRFDNSIFEELGFEALGIIWRSGIMGETTLIGLMGQRLFGKCPLHDCQDGYFSIQYLVEHDLFRGVLAGPGGQFSGESQCS